jgi:PAS domain S-box-containing protein
VEQKPMGGLGANDPVSILLVDDRPENLLVLEASLLSNHELGEVKLVRAQSGAEALRAVLQQEFAVILLDVQMPVMDGFETASLIRSKPGAEHTPIIFLTAVNTSDKNVFRGYSLGAVDYLFKPFEPEILRAKVAVFVELHRKKLEVQRMAEEARLHAQLLRTSNNELAKTNKLMGALYHELEQRRDELSQERDFVNTIIETAGSFIIIFDADGRLVRFNRASAEISGINIEDFKGKFAWDLLVSKDEGQKIKQAFEAVRAGKTVSLEMNLDPPGKEQRRLSMSFAGVFMSNGRPLNVIASGVDITDRYQAEERIKRINEELEVRVKLRTKELETTNVELVRAKDSAEAANRAKDQFLAVLSHELRTPLTPVLAITQMLREDPSVSDDVKSWVETISRNIELEARLIDDLLDLTSISKGKLALHLETLNLHKSIEETLAMCKDGIESKKLQLDIALEAKSADINCDPARIKQVLWNLIKNAVKFTPEGGRVLISTQNAGDKILCRVRDTGIGIASEHLERVFNAFDQGDSSITKRFGGLGLGLAISKALVEQHGGKLSAVSEGVDKGTTFTLELPLSVPKPSQPSPKNGKAASANGSSHQDKPRGRVLLVEDNLDTSRVMQVLLERAGMTVVVARSVGAAIEIAKTYPCDFVISDISLPDGTGMDVLKKINEVRPTRGIAVSGYGMPEDIQRSLDAGFSVHLVKPINFSELNKALEHLTEVEV